MVSVDWNQLRAFAATVDCGTLSSAARRLGLTQPTLSRQIAALETSLGVALFARVGKRLVPTEAGLSVMHHARTMASAADAMALAAAGQAQEVAGRVTISATDAIAAYLLPDIVRALRQTAPQITLTIVASNALSDLRRREADIAIRHVRPLEPDLIARLIGEMPAHVYAAAAWLEGRDRPATLAELGKAGMLAFEPAESFAAHLATIGIPAQVEDFPIVSENAVVLWEMVRQGLGIGIMLEAVAKLTPGMVRLAPDHAGIQVPIWLVSHRELHTSRRVRVVFDTMAEVLARHVRKGRSVRRSEGL
ncbi:MAG: LysR family transcriptional regulator [Phreatobacter sp.]|uniref:LysR family transcriptional regulator n=1 Tax=Phreatobacter sp. TaxID=1966341 RepID=UPI002732C381|nr:LysR family transcriptional regulator [Phreatobacter sp.]MDP2800793.1 LysR family transcriptional regulator [Phreatobacter sp.]